MSSTSPPTNHTFHCWCVLPDFGDFVPSAIRGGHGWWFCLFCFGVAGPPGRVCVFLNHVPGSGSYECRASTRGPLRPGLPFSGQLLPHPRSPLGGSVSFAHPLPLPGGGVFTGLDPSSSRRTIPTPPSGRRSPGSSVIESH